MNCNEAAYILFNFQESFQPSAHLTVLHEHLAECSGCQRLIDPIRKLKNLNRLSAA